MYMQSSILMLHYVMYLLMNFLACGSESFSPLTMVSSSTLPALSSTLVSHELVINPINSAQLFLVKADFDDFKGAAISPIKREFGQFYNDTLLPFEMFANIHITVYIHVGIVM